MVAQLESLSKTAASSPETQWRTQIALRSAQEADQDLSGKLLDFQAGSHYEPQEAWEVTRVQGASRKLQRDFSRIHSTYQDLVEAYTRQQQADLSYLMNGGAPPSSGGEAKEEFFDRAMREREEEVQKINQSMHKVNEIYQDLAGLVDTQQDQIDRIGEAAEESKARTKSGLEHIQQGILALCGPSEASIDQDIRQSERTTTTNNSSNPRMTPPSLSEILQLVEEIQTHWQERLAESTCHSAWTTTTCDEGPISDESTFLSYTYSSTQ